MAVKREGFTHRDKFSGYMGVVVDVLGAPVRPMRVLDIPAGAGHLSDALRQRGYEVVSADFNRDRPDYVFTDMNKRLPFENASFDVVTCLEGIEHVLDPFHLIGELSRVCRPGSRVIISTPNILSFHSRMQFLFTGTYFMFNPASLPHVEPGQELDRGHISPMSCQQLQYMGGVHGLRLMDVRTDKYKRKMWAPLFVLVEAMGRPIKSAMFRKYENGTGTRERNQTLYRALCSPAVTFGRTLICAFEKSVGT
jgi:SAM-dependent methyltransferase